MSLWYRFIALTKEDFEYLLFINKNKDFNFNEYLLKTLFYISFILFVIKLFTL